MSLTRRNFLVGAASAAGLSAIHLSEVDATAGQPGGGTIGSTATNATEYATLLDIEKCIGCGQCVEGCRDRNGHRYPEVKKPLPAMFPPGAGVPDLL